MAALTIMLNKFLSTVKKYNMINPGDRVLACVSGGADSVALLLLLNDAKDFLNISITVAHVNHMIRGAEADRDEDFVRNLSSDLDIPCVVARINIPELAEECRQSIELTARDERYSFFNSLDCDKICTAHTKTDSAETFLMNICRGTGLHGLTSIPPVRDNIVRPLIEFSRSETEQCCKNHGVSFITDSTNLTADCTRNKIRLNVIPLLNEISPSFENSVSRCISSVSTDEDCLYKLSSEVFNNRFNASEKTLDVNGLKSTHFSILSRVVIKYISSFDNCDPEKYHIDYICDNIDKSFSLSLPGGLTVGGNGRFLYPVDTIQNSQLSLRLSKYDYNEFEYCGIKYSCFPSYTDSTEIFDGDLLIDFESVSDYFTVRNRMPGDKVRLKKRNCTKTLKKLFNELKLTPEERARSVMFTDEKGIFALSGFNNKINCSENILNNKYLVIRFRRL